MYVSHPLIKKNKMESREYQESILSKARETNTLVCLPTGLGKTPVAVVLAADRLHKYPNSKVLILAPTKPLVNQHYKSFLGFMEMEEGELQVVTGETKPTDRYKLYQDKRILFATPQTIRNDLETRKIDLKNFSLLVLDEVHHSVGEYAYPYVARKYLEQSENERILGLTASPGGTWEKIKEICRNTGLETVEIRTEKDEEVSPYVKEKQNEWVEVDLPESFDKIRKILLAVESRKKESLKSGGFVKGKYVNKTQLLKMQQSFMQEINQGYTPAFGGLSLVVQSIKLGHAITILETQGIPMLEKYWKKLGKEKSRSTISLLKDKSISNAMYLTNQLYEEGFRHPKMSKLCSILDKEFREKPDSRIIVFASYRDTVSDITKILGKISGAKPVEFIGQKGGLTQKEQIDRLEQFKQGVYNVLVCTSIGEEGLHVANADLAIFYEPVASEIRSIQRRGRVGRENIGRIITLITRGTKDQASYWSSHHKEKKMKSILYTMQGETQTTLEDLW